MILDIYDEILKDYNRTVDSTNKYEEIFTESVLTYIFFIIIVIMISNMIMQYMLEGKVFISNYERRYSDHYGYYALMNLILIISFGLGFIIVETLGWGGFVIDVIVIGGIFTLLILKTKKKAENSRLTRKLLDERRKRKASTQTIKNDSDKQKETLEKSVKVQEEVKQIEFDEVWEQQYFKACFDIGFQPDKKYNTNQVLRNKYNLLEELYANQAIMNEIKFKKQEENITSSTQFYYDNHEKINEYIKMTEIDVIKNKYNEYIQMRDIEIW